MKVATPAGFRDAVGLRRMWTPPDAQWMAGAFTLDASLANGSATDVDLTTHDAWYGDVDVSQSYSLTDGSTAKIKAAVQIDAVELVVMDGSFSKLDVDTKQKILARTTGPYLYVGVGGTVRKIGLFGAISDGQQLVQVTQASAADGERGVIRGGPRALFAPIRIDLENNDFRLKTDTDVALGAATACRVILYGAIVPGTQALTGALPGSCSSIVELDPPAGQQPVAFIRSQTLSAGLWRPTIPRW